MTDENRSDVDRRFGTDVEGYSRLMGNDEEATVRTLKSYHSGAVERIRSPLILNFIESFETTFGVIHLKERRQL